MNNNEPASLMMEISPDMEQQFKGEPFFLEIEMLQGKKEQLQDGRIRYELVIDDMDKVLLVKEFVLKCISQSHKTNLS